jgi:hypothetical protein
MLSCPSCGAEVPGGFAFCGQCGAPLLPGPGMEERRDGPSCYRADPLPVVARIGAAAGRPELAGRFLAGADAPAARYRHCMAAARAVLAEAAGDLPAAADRYDDAAAGCSRPPPGPDA